MAAFRSNFTDDDTVLGSIGDSPKPSSENRSNRSDRSPRNLRKSNDDAISFENSFTGMMRQPTSFDRTFGITCIVLHECLHSAAFYILIPTVLYLKIDGPLKYSDNQAAVIILAFTGVAFLLPLIGGIVGDTVLGRYNAILFGTVIEFLGMIIILLSAIIVYVDNNISIPVAKFLFVTSLILIAFGMGFIKANVTTFGAGQLYDTTDSATKTQSYYRWYVFAINFGKLVAFCPISFLANYVPSVNASSANTTSYSFMNATNVTTADEPIQKDVFAVGVAVIQVGFVGMAIFIFMIGKAKYKMIEPSGGHHMYYIFCFNRTPTGPALYNPDHQEYIHQLKIYKRTVFRITILMAALFAMYTLYETVAFQMVSVWMLQYKELSQPANVDVHLPLTFMNTFSTAVIILSIPLLERLSRRRHTIDDVTNEEIDDVIAKWVKEDNRRRSTRSRNQHQTSITNLVGARRKRFASLSNRFNKDSLDEEVRQKIAEDLVVSHHRRQILIKMAIGLGLAAAAALCAGILESVRKNYIGLGIENQPSIFWQLPQYVIMGTGETLGAISAYEFASCECLPGLQGFTIGMFISTYGLGSLFALLCYGLAAGSFTDPQDLNDFNMEYVYFGILAFLLLITLAFTVLARLYHMEHPCRLEEPKCPYSDDEEDEKF